MHRLVIIFCLFIFFSSAAQIRPDSAFQKKDSVVDIVKPPVDTNHYAKIEFQQNDENLKRLMQQIKDREKQEKQLAYLRIGLGIAFLIVLIIGISRRRKRNTP